jgi:spore germination protein
MLFWRNLSIGWLAAFAVTVASAILGLGILVVTGNRSQTSPQPAISQPPAADISSSTYVSTLPTTPPVKRPTSCPAASLASSSGAWVVPWLDTPDAADSIPVQAKRLGLLDFFWLALGPSPGTILQHPADQDTRPLDSVLAAAHSANPCGLRFVTTVDNFSGSADPTDAKGWLARILLDPQARQQHVQALAAEMARHPLADGLTVDYEFKLPTAADLPLYAKVGHLDELLPNQPDQLVDRITTGYSRLMQDLTLAMHHQQRQLRVTTLVRDQGQRNYENLPGYISDYGALSRGTDQLILMAYDYHWSTGDPGPIAPLNWIRNVWSYAETYNISPGRLAIALPAYAYDWSIDGSGKTGGEATDLTPTQVSAANWPKVGSQDGETHYTYRDGQGGLHQVWDAASGLATKVAAVRLFCGCSVMAWKVGNGDPAGSRLVLGALG